MSLDKMNDPRKESNRDADNEEDKLSQLQRSLESIQICQNFTASPLSSCQNGSFSTPVRTIKVRCHPNEVPFTVHGGAARNQLILIEFIHHPDLLNVLHTDDVILSVDGRQISGMLLSDVQLLLDVSFVTKELITLEIINGASIPNDLTELLSNKDYAELQKIIRINVYQKTVPYTTRPRKADEIDGVHYRFVNVAFFSYLQQTNQLLEYGHYQGDHSN
ncbi:unnamed protein product [Anisakis simplex]|uniref:Guanylate kinase-like domain-containing protein n=1 Tax=Anisakis simplex TaxID=6269 RepID=A0A0M3JR72_ANISI|nr:unnamed protein product [Anisakis simplex]